MPRAALIYPHQLYPDHPACDRAAAVVLVEDPLLFTQYAFHRQKLLFHRASLVRYGQRLRDRGHTVHHIEAGQLADSGAVATHLVRLGIHEVAYVDPCDDWLSTRLAQGLADAKISATVLDDPHFLTPTSWIDRYTANKPRLFFTDFYIAQRKRLGVLVTEDNKPLGGQWSYDPENRKKLPRNLTIPPVDFPPEDAIVAEARRAVRSQYPNAPGSDASFLYPTDHAEAETWLHAFVRDRLPSFGDYEDAIHSRHDILFHSVLTPLLNSGLLSPRQVVDAALARQAEVPLNSLEGFVRQVIGWREFVRLVYLTRGRRQRCRNFWGFTRAIPSSFYDGTTGIDPVDTVIRRVLRTGYCHHIERLMVLGNFFLLCEFSPDSVYRWFMELFIDAYDWVMVPNVYGMSQYADGGGMTTKPYLSGSAYIRKMSDFPSGPWCAVWDALYWRFVDEHAEVFASNPRTSVLVKMRDKLGARITEHRRRAEDFLARLTSPPNPQR